MRKFIVQLEEDAHTRWRTDEPTQLRGLTVLIEQWARIQTEGSRPAVTVIRDESFEVPFCGKCQTYHTGNCESTTAKSEPS